MDFLQNINFPIFWKHVSSRKPQFFLSVLNYFNFGRKMHSRRTTTLKTGKINTKLMKITQTKLGFPR